MRERDHLDESREELLARAKDILRRKQLVSPEEKFKLARKLSANREYGYARRLLARARRANVTDHVLRVKLRRHYAYCTYKDWNLPLDERLNRALEILSEDEDLDTTRNQETLGLAGDIYHERWEAQGQKHILERALGFFLRGFEEGAAYDFGYTGRRAALALDLLANIEETGPEEPATARRERARDIRQHLVKTLTEAFDKGEFAWLKGEWWIYEGIAEAYFGLGDYERAGEWLSKLKELPPTGWQLELITRQFTRLARLQAAAARGPAPQAGDAAEELASGPAWSVVRDFLSGTTADIRSFAIGKVGLALAGGGFRAALFHIGVLARLAELDLLRHVEVLSCSSGGAIVGTHYYLEVRKLLEAKPDAEINGDDYVKVVQRLERHFLSGVQRNIRMRCSAGVAAGLKSIFKRAYSRSEHLGTLLEQEFFAKVGGGENSPLHMSDLFINPRGAPPGFHPKRDNWQRAAKVPILILNATALNTGHNWQFTASWMGESPYSINTETDANDCLRPMYYTEAPPGYRQLRLGRAVAATACIPGLFEPISFTDLYPGRIVRLTDGNVHGSQGATSLLEQRCDVLLVCDASGEFGSQAQPASGQLEVPRRAANILLARARAMQFDALKALRQAEAVRGLMYVHLMKGLNNRSVGWVGCDEPPDVDDDGQPASQRGPLTRYGIRKDVQASLAAIRTDLDSFSDVEAFALMTCGYRMTEHEFATCIENYPVPRAPARPLWRFLAVEEPLKSSSTDPHEGPWRLLKVSSNRGFKVWRLSTLTERVLVILPLPLLSLLLLTDAFTKARAVLHGTRVTAGWLLLALAVVCLLLVLGKLYLAARDSPKRLSEILLDLWQVLSGFVTARVYLAVFNPFYLRLGRVADPSPQLTPAEAKKEAGGAEESATILQNVRSAIEQSRPVQAVNRFFYPSDPAVNRFADRNLLVETVGRLLEAGGYEAIRFPRARDLNPLNIDLDLIARKGDHYICIEIKKQGETAQPIDWKSALELEVAAQALQAARGQQPRAQPASDPAPTPSVAARLVLVDVTPDATLENFAAQHAVGLIYCRSEQMISLHDQADQYLRLVPGQTSAETEQKGRLWAEMQPLFESLVSGAANPAPERREVSNV